MAGVSLKGIVKAYGAVQVVHGIDLDVQEKEFVVLVGPSGCGKTSLLKLLLGLESPSEGSVHIGSRNLQEISEHWLRQSCSASLQRTSNA